jgi:hypothetical protein
MDERFSKFLIKKKMISGVQDGDLAPVPVDVRGGCSGRGLETGGRRRRFGHR